MASHFRLYYLLHLLDFFFSTTRMLFKYLGSFVAARQQEFKDFLTRKAQAWKACNKLHIIWQSNILRKTKLDFFRACVESIILYGSKTWTLKKDLQDRLDGTYTRLLMRVQNISWSEHKN